MINAAERSPMPNHKMARGIQARGGIGRRVSITGVSMSRSRRDQPQRMPSGMAATQRKHKTEPDALEAVQAVKQQPVALRQPMDGELLHCSNNLQPARAVCRREEVLLQRQPATAQPPAGETVFFLVREMAASQYFQFDWSKNAFEKRWSTPSGLT